jgi:hypothetical protein
VSYPGKLKSLSVPSEAWETISMNFIEGLPKPATTNCILVIIDTFTKYNHFLPLSHPYTASSVALVFFNMVYRLHGLPAGIMSDRDPVFINKFWPNLFKLSGTTLKMSSAYHPQMDRHTKHINQCLETFLHCFVHSCPKK